jgi:hypothetical protein
MRSLINIDSKEKVQKQNARSQVKRQIKVREENAVHVCREFVCNAEAMGSKKKNW